MHCPDWPDRQLEWIIILSELDSISNDRNGLVDVCNISKALEADSKRSTQISQIASLVRIIIFSELNGIVMIRNLPLNVRFVSKAFEAPMNERPRLDRMTGLSGWSS
jgi:hypothetical protein